MRHLLLLFFITGCYILHAQTYPIGNQVITYQDPARSNRNIQTYLYYPATSAGTGTPLATGSFPVVVIGHGFVMNYAPYVVYADTLTPKGYIVAIVNTETGLSPSHSNYGLDLAFVISKLYAEHTNSSSPFFQHVTLTSCMMGHSMGGGCTILGSAVNANVTCTATFALAETTPSAIAAATSVTASSLVFSGSDDCVAPAAAHQTPVYNNLPGCKSFVSIIDGGHCGFAAANFNCNFGEMTCNPGGPALSATAQRAIVFKLLTPWLDRFLKSNLAAGPVYAAQLATLASQNSITFFNPCASLPLPVELTAFEVTRSGQQVAITWKTDAEEKVAFFTVEKSHDGITFTPIDRQLPKGAGNAYFSGDQLPLLGVNYYRLVVTDLDGDVQYSPIQSIYFQTDKYFLLSPNPSQGIVHLFLGKAGGQSVQLQVFNIAGVAVPVEVTAAEGGEYAFAFPEGALDGIYFCYWFADNGTGACGRVLLQR
jgi:predicted dienelactone hydrolase